MGEKVLTDLRENDYKIGKFLHNVQAIRFLDDIEDLNLTLQVLDGILCHNGEVTDNQLCPEGDSTWDGFEDKIKRILVEMLKPLTYEGCVVRIADNIAYLGRDLEDAIELDLLDISDFNAFPQTCKELFNIDFNQSKRINWIILDTLIKDIINTSYGKKTIGFSSDVLECVKQLKKFNYDNIYLNKKLHEEDYKIEMMFSSLFEYFYNAYEHRDTSSLIYKHMTDCDWISGEYKKSVSSTELVRDYIAGMTDRYFDKIL